MPVAPNNPHKIGTSEWYEYNTPGIFNASKDYTPAQTQQQFQTRVMAGEVDPKTGKTNYPSHYGGNTGINPQFSSYGGVGFFDGGGTQYGANGAMPPPGRPPGSSGGGRGGGGGGGGGAAKPNMAGIYSLMSQYKPQQFQWKDLEYEAYKPSKYRPFNSKQYDLMRNGLTEAIGADRASGMATYGDLRNEYAAYQDPFSAQNTVMNPAQNAAMQRMMQANGVPTDINQADTNRGVQADQAFGNLLTILSGVGRQNQDARLRAVGGDERRLNERLDAEQRGGNLAVNMSEAQARDLYEKEKWQFGEQVAQQNYANRMATRQYNNQGQNQTAQSNTQMTNDVYGGNFKAILDLMAAGMASPNDMQMAATLGITPEIVAAVNASKAATPPATGA